MRRALAATAAVLLAEPCSSCVLHGTDRSAPAIFCQRACSGVCDMKFDPGYHDMPNGWDPQDTVEYRNEHMPRGAGSFRSSLQSALSLRFVSRRRLEM